MKTDLKEAIAVFSEKLGFLLGSGVPLVSALETIMAEMKDEPLANSLRQVRRRISEGCRFCEALGEFPAVFSPSYLSMIRAGEGQGILDTMMGKIARGMRDGLIPVGGSMEKDVDPVTPESVEISQMLEEAVQKKAANLHLVPTIDGLEVMIRVDGRLVELKRLPLSLREPVIARVKFLGQLDLGEKYLPQDGRVLMTVAGKHLDIRINVLPVALGEKVTMQLLSRDDLRWRPEEIFPDAGDRARFQEMISAGFGLMVMAGPSGSGKTTTAYYALQALRERGAGSIVSVEFPVAGMVEGVAQVPVRPHLGMDYKQILNSVLRSDPDVVYVGDVPDEAVLASQIKMALTGHLVLVNLHAASVPDVFQRLLALNAPPHLLASAISGVVVQRLVRKVCPECAIEARVSAADLKAFGQKGRALKAREGKGCERCNHSGYRGRVPLYEFLQPDKAFKDCLQTGDLAQLRASLAQMERRTLIMAGLDLVAAGKTTISELQRVLRDYEVPA